MIENLLNGFVTALAPANMLVIVLSTFAGLWIGIIPGLGPVMAMAILFPFTFTMDPLAGLLMLASIHVSGTYGGSISAIMINIPGDPASAASTFEGYAMAKQGRVKTALAISLTSSFIGAIVGVIVLILAAEPLVRFALMFGPAEYFMLAVLGLCVVAAASKGSTLKGLSMGALGLAISFVGTDSVLGYPRFTFGIVELEAKIDFVPVMIGLFAIAEVMRLMTSRESIAGARALTGSFMEGVRATFSYPMTILRGLGIGVFIGVVPGIGAVTSNLLSYIVERRAAKDQSRFGNGAPEGLIAPEVANNATVAAALIPTLTLGIPGSSGAAMLLIAIQIHGLKPGPLLFNDNTTLVYGFFAGLIIGAFVFAAMGVLLMRTFSLVTIIPAPVLAPILLAISLVGAYAYDQNPLDLVYAVAAGLLGFLAHRQGFPVLGLVMGIVLGEMAETSFHQALQIGGGSYLALIARPLSGTIFLVCMLTLFGPWLLEKARGLRNPAPATGA